MYISTVVDVDDCDRNTIPSMPTRKEGPLYSTKVGVTSVYYVASRLKTIFQAAHCNLLSNFVVFNVVFMSTSFIISLHQQFKEETHSLFDRTAWKFSRKIGKIYGRSIDLYSKSTRVPALLNDCEIQ